MKTLIKQAITSDGLDELTSYFPSDVLESFGIEVAEKLEPIEPVQEKPSGVFDIPYKEGQWVRHKRTGQIGQVKIIELFAGMLSITLLYEDGTESDDCYYWNQLEAIC